MQYQSDYVLRLIEQLGGLIRRALERVGVGSDEEPIDLAEQAVGLALDMDPAIASRLSPESLATLLQMNLADDRVIHLVGEALEIEAGLLEGRAELIEAKVRRDQAEAVRALLGPNRAN